MKRIALISTLILLTSVYPQDLGAPYLIITHDNYYDALQPLAQWKTQKGIKTKIVKISDIGGDSTQIRDFIVNAYNAWQIQPEYLLLVGNDDQIPFPRILQHTYICHSDNYYANTTGDFHNEIIPGRFWVNNLSEVKTFVAKVLSYEQRPYLSDSLWFRKGVTIVNEDQDSMPSDSIYWADARYMHHLMTDAGFEYIDSFSEYYGHDTSDLLSAINDGRSYILYRGVGGGAWSGPFCIYHPENMCNGFRLPVVISGTCATIEGIGRLWTSAGTPEEPKGAVGFLGTTTGLMNAAALRSALTRGTLENIVTDSMSTLGKAAEAGRLKFYELFNDSLEYDSWNCLGDPEMTIWTTIPQGIDVAHNVGIPVGLCTLFADVQFSANTVPIESALVCIMSKTDTTVYHYGLTDNMGHVEFTSNVHSSPDTIFFTVTGRNLYPHKGFTLVQFTGGPHVLFHSFSISDTPGGNSDSIANPGEGIEIPLWIKNWGDSTAYSVSGILRKDTIDTFFTLNDTVKDFGDLMPLDSVCTTDGYNVIIEPNCPDTHIIQLQLVVKDVNDSTWLSNFNFMVHAPMIQLRSYHFPEGIKYTLPGDTNELRVELDNLGSYKAENVICRIFSNDSLFTAIDSLSSFGTIPPNGTASNQDNPFKITVLPETPVGYTIFAQLEITSGVYTDTLDIAIYVGQKDYLIWDPDPNNSSGPIIKNKLDELGFFGEYCDTILPYDDLLTIYKSLFVCLGILPHTYVVKDTSQAGQEIKRYIDLFDGNVYIEGGDVWYSDPLARHGYPFHPLFCINPLANTVGPFTQVSGEDGTFTQSMIFNYSGENLSIDRIHPDNGGILIFKKTTDNAFCGVAANNKTVGVSFELGGFNDSIPPSTKLVLVDSIMKYFGIPPTGIQELPTNQSLVARSIEIYPNPSRHRVIIQLAGFNTENMKLKIYDVSGRNIKDICFVFDEFPVKQIIWDGTDSHGNKLPNGVYFLKINAEDYTDTRKFVLLR